MWKKGDLSDFEWSMTVGTRRVGLSILNTAYLLVFPTQCEKKISTGWHQLKIPCYCQRSKKLGQSASKARVIQITTCCNRGMQKSSECKP